MIIIPGFPPENLFSQALEIWLPYDIRQRESKDGARPERKMKTENTRRNIFVPSENSGDMPGFGRAARNSLCFQLKAVYNKTPLPIRIHIVCQRGPGDTKKNEK